MGKTMKLTNANGVLIDHRRIRRGVYKTLHVIRARGYGQPHTGGVDGNIRRHRNIALYRLKHQLRKHQNKLNVLRNKRS